MASSKQIPDKDHLDVKRRQMIDSFVQVGQAMRTCADTVQAFADASALANPTDIGSLLSILAAGHSLATNISGSAPSAGGLEQSFEEDAKDKKKRKRALKDPNAPKRPVTAYLQFQNEVKNEVQDQHRDKSYKDILRLVAEKWKGLDDGIKNLYTERHKRDMLIYEQRVKAYKAAIAEGRIPTSVATAFADVKDDEFEVAHDGEDDEDDEDAVSQDAAEKSDSDDSDDSDDEEREPTPPPAKKSKTASKSKKSLASDEIAPSSTPASSEKKKEKKDKKKKSD